MNIEKLPVFKSDERGIAYNCDKVRFFQRKQGTVSGDHIHPEPESLYLTSGKAELMVGETVHTVEAPVKITIEGNVQHRLIAITDIEFIEDR